MRKKIRPKKKASPKGERIDPKGGPSAADLDAVAADPFYAKIFVGKPRC